MPSASFNDIAEVHDEQPKRASLSDIVPATDKPQPSLRAATPWERVTGAVSRTLSNIAPSGAKYIGDTAEALFSPRKTLESIGAIPVGIYEKMGLPTPSSWGKPGERQSERQLDSMVQHYKTRYGSPSAVAETIQSDPVGFASDVSAVAALPASLPGKAGRIASTVADVTNPLVAPGLVAGEATHAALGTSAIGGRVRPWLQNKAVDEYQSALKVPPSWHKPDELKQMLNTAMDEGVKLDYIPSHGGALGQVRGKIDAINKHVAGAVAEGAAEGKAVDPVRVAGTTRRSQEAFTTVDPADRAPIDALKGRFLKEHSVDAPYTKIRPGVAEEAGGYVPEGEGVRSVPVDIPVDRAQRLKQNTYRELRDSAYGEQVGAVREGKKDLAHGLMEGVYEQLAEKHPELASLGRKEKVLIDLEDAIERWATRQGNRDQVSLKTMASNPLAIYELIRDNPGIKSRFAIALRRAAQNKRATPGVPVKRQTLNVADSVNRESGEDQQPEQ